MSGRCNHHAAQWPVTAAVAKKRSNAARLVMRALMERVDDSVSLAVRRTDWWDTTTALTIGAHRVLDGLHFTRITFLRSVAVYTNNEHNVVVSGGSDYPVRLHARKVTTAQNDDKWLLGPLRVDMAQFSNVCAMCDRARRLLVV